MWNFFRDRGVSFRSRIALQLALLSIVATGSAVAESSPSYERLKTRMIDALHLRAGDLISLSVNRTPGVAQRISIPINGRMYVLDVARHSVRTRNYQVRTQIANGRWTLGEPGPVRTIRGTLDGIGGEVVGAVLDQGLFAKVTLPDGGGTYWVEPLMGRIEGAQRDLHAIYADGDAILDGGTCAVATRKTRFTAAKAPTREGGFPPGCDGLPCEVELACDSDFEFFAIHRGQTEARINFIINVVNRQYESEVSIIHRLTSVTIRTDPKSDPYQATDVELLLGEFRTNWLTNLQDILADEHQLFTGKALVPPLFGMSWGIGQVCGDGAFCLVRDQSAFDTATDLSAHELGHLWGASHCLCGVPPFTMNSSITGANRFEPFLTIPDIIAHRETRTCLDSLAPPITLPFYDPFDGIEVDPDSWHAIGATVDDLGNGEPSPESSLRISGRDKVYSGHCDASALDMLGVSYWWQRTGDTNSSPELGEDLVLEYKKLDGQWAEFDRQLGDPGGGGDDLPYERACAILPDDADLSRAQIRFRMVGDDLTLNHLDTFFVDDVRIADGTELLEITTQPMADCICSADDVELSVAAAGVGPITFQWKRNGFPIPGETASTLVITSMTQQDAGRYTVEVTNGCGAQLESDVAELLKSDTPKVLEHPQDGEVNIGEELALNVVAVDECIAFQWWFNGVAILGQDDSDLIIKNVQCANQGCYSAEITTGCGMIMSQTAEIVVNGDCGPFSCADTVAPVILHDNEFTKGAGPFSGFIDPRRESDNGIDLNQGITEVYIQFSEPVQAVGGGPLTAGSFAVTETGIESPPKILSIDGSQMPLVKLTLSRPITLQQYTTIQAKVQDMAAAPNLIVNAGNLGPDLDETDRVDIGFLPADMNQNGCVNPLDVTRFRQFVNDVVEPQFGAEEDYTDVDRNGRNTPLDLTALRQLVNGTGNATRTWAFQCMESDRP